MKDAVSLRTPAMLCAMIISLTGLSAQEAARPNVPDDLIDDPHVREELGINQFTAPSIKRIFDDLDKLAPLPTEEVAHKMPERMPLNRSDLALEIGFLIADGFMAVQAGQLNKIEPLAKELSRYGRALGAGERVNRHAASLLKSARNNDVESLKNELSATQRDVETDLIHLRDVDLAHLISLGGWIRALEVGSLAVDKKYTQERAKNLYREDITDYYEGSIASLDPRISERKDIANIRLIIIELRTVMTLKEGEQPSAEGVKKINELAKKLSTLALSRGQ
ncbi:hypothetical protein HW115_03535 [Verrucomicrobiaceae bacterium N1E253]|uniref:Uncharacterized protein n=1 Tax=Oceaniferula marina TaxID=2748318 RepID=A0A851GA93_9BACT|nr:hypothetical protein [Oceaniferula marina]NWK54668.1 hypothetical protein [Oceaniferula marina]